MKYETFKKELEALRDLLEINSVKENRLSEVFGGDTQILTDDCGYFVEHMLGIIAEEMEDDNETVEWLFWESIMMDEEVKPTFNINGIEFEGNIRNIWLDLKGELSEKDKI